MPIPHLRSILAILSRRKPQRPRIGAKIVDPAAFAAAWAKAMPVDDFAAQKTP